MRHGQLTDGTIGGSCISGKLCCSIVPLAVDCDGALDILLLLYK